jgi:hypothetical protein
MFHILGKADYTCNNIAIKFASVFIYRLNFL